MSLTLMLLLILLSQIMQIVLGPRSSSIFLSFLISASLSGTDSVFWRLLLGSSDLSGEREAPLLEFVEIIILII